MIGSLFGVGKASKRQFRRSATEGVGGLQISNIQPTQYMDAVLRCEAGLCFVQPPTNNPACCSEKSINWCGSPQSLHGRLCE